MEAHPTKRIDIAIRIAFVMGVCAAVWLWPKTVHVSPSFDCTKAMLPTEQLICGNPALSKIDADFAIYYADNLATVAIAGDRTTLDALVIGQRDFMSVRDRCDRNEFCVMLAYGNRERQVRGLVGGPPPPADFLNGTRAF